METKNTSNSRAILLFIVGLLITIPAIIYSGFAMTVVWGWFVTPALGLAVPSIPMMLGLSSLVHYMSYQFIDFKNEKDAEDQLISAIAVSLSRPSILLIFGYIYHSFV
jgi:hypothetical protein